MRVGTSSSSGALPHPFDAQEASVPRLLKAVLFVLSPLLLVLVVVRVLLFLLAAVFMAVVCSLATMGRRDELPLTGGRRTFSRLGVALVGRLLLLAFGCWPGLFTVHGEWDTSCPAIAVAPHAGALDGFIFLCLGFPRPVILEPYAKIPVVKQILQAANALLVPIQSSAKSSAVRAVDVGGGAKKTNATADAILRHKRSYDPSASGAAPVVLFAEGITHSGRQLLPFFRGAFEGGSPVQPVVLRYPYRHHNAAAWTRPFLDSLGTHLVRMFCTPWMRITVDYLPPHRPSVDEAQDGQLMAEAVRGQMAAFSGLPLHPLGARELRKEMQEEADQRDAAKAAKVGKALC